MPKSPESPKKYTPEEIADLEKSRTISDAELLKGGAKYEIDEQEDRHLRATAEQKNRAHSMMDFELMEKQESLDKKLKKQERQKKSKIILEQMEALNLKGGELLRIIDNRYRNPRGIFIFSNITEDGIEVINPFHNANRHKKTEIIKIDDIDDIGIETNKDVLDELDKEKKWYGPFKDGTRIYTESDEVFGAGDSANRKWFIVDADGNLVADSETNQKRCFTIMDALERGLTIEEILRPEVENKKEDEFKKFDPSI